jgi:hypothetical protein
MTINSKLEGPIKFKYLYMYNKCKFYDIINTPGPGYQGESIGIFLKRIIYDNSYEYVIVADNTKERRYFFNRNNIHTWKETITKDYL